MVRSEANCSAFYKCSYYRFIYVAVYVDNIGITSDDHERIAGLNNVKSISFSKKIRLTAIFPWNWGNSIKGKYQNFPKKLCSRYLRRDEYVGLQTE